MPTLKDLAIDGLSNMQESGQLRVTLDDGARRILREWIRKPAQQNAAEALPHQAEQHKSSPPGIALSGPPEAPRMADTESKLAYLRERAAHWHAAKKLGTLRDTMVFACGSPHAQLMLVGEAPGYDEERLGEPFVGKAGQKLNQILAAMGLKREDVYISNVCKFRPSMGEHQGTANRPPNEQEIAACLPLILAEIRAIQPSCIVCLGGSAAKGLLNTTANVSNLRGSWHRCQDIPVRVTYHPSYLLRNESIKAKRAVWEDMLAAMEQLHMPITDKQRRYFLSA